MTVHALPLALSNAERRLPAAALSLLPLWSQIHIMPGQSEEALRLKLCALSFTGSTVLPRMPHVYALQLCDVPLKLSGHSAL